MIQNNTKRYSNDINIVIRGDRRTFPESSQNLPESSRIFRRKIEIKIL